MQAKRIIYCDGITWTFNTNNYAINIYTPNADNVRHITRGYRLRKQRAPTNHQNPTQWRPFRYLCADTPYHIMQQVGKFVQHALCTNRIQGLMPMLPPQRTQHQRILIRRSVQLDSSRTEQWPKRRTMTCNTCSGTRPRSSRKHSSCGSPIAACPKHFHR